MPRSVTSLWRRVVDCPPALAAWIGEGGELRAGRVPRSAWPLVAGSIARAAGEAGAPVLILVPGPERFLRELRPWLGGTPPAHLFEEIAVNFLDRPPAFDAAVNARLDALAALASGAPAVVVSSRRAAMRSTIGPAALAAASLALQPGVELDPAAAAARLAELGYSREPLVEAPGQFSLRGGILDVFPATGGSPVRAEWFGSVVETLRLFDAGNQRSILAVPRVTVRPGREVLLGQRRGAEAAALVRAQAGLETLRADVRAEWEDELERLAAGVSFPGVELFAAYLEPELPSLFDHLPRGTLIVDLEPGRQLAEVREMESETLTLAAAEAGDGELPRGFRPPMVPAGRLSAEGFPRLLVFTAEEEGALDLGWVAAEPVVGRPAALPELLASRRGQPVVIASEQGERVIALLAEAGREVPPEAELDLDLELEPGLRWADLDVAAGCANETVGFWLLTDTELFGRVRRPAARRGPRTARQASLTLEFQPGEHIVHVDHGVGRFLGMRLMEVEGGNREYLELEYAEGDRLFVPVESLERVQKYLGGGEGTPPLHRLGSSDWARARSRARRSVQDVAEDLLKIYAAREARAGFSFAPDAPWQTELEESFPYEETPDQAAALAEIKADMEAPRPMDRLLCGDVGFGKTELALRAAFKAVMSGRQVALLAPTTILAQQHYQVFSKRLQPYPVRVDVLSRFRSDAEQAETVAALKAGQVDIVIGTHRLLQRDVRFKRLGLAIVDEEQRFGVMQKERLKKIRTDVDMLSLSATPIPRTLHMATAGIRDMSVIQTPPEDRQPIKTYVTADEDGLVREVVQRELDRGGQVYYLHNRVKSIQAAAERVARLVPGARIGIGHGQMEEDDLARVMVEFAAGAFDVLVCTTIIESGLDIPNANTLVVERADRFGLAQLYQLRGRVGRAGKRAYAYFLYDPRRSLTESADKRLDVISGLHELGQGFRIALRDLEIRGAGNLLGTEQHGAIAAVGFEMYLQMLQSAVARLRGGEPLEHDPLSVQEMTLDLPLDHFIPRSYIRDERLRLGAYRELAATESEEELDAHLRSLRDRYGEPPVQLDNLAYSLRVKLAGQRLGLRAVAVEGDQVTVRVDPERPLDVDSVAAAFSGRLRILPNRLLLRTGGAWREALMLLLDRLEQSYQHAQGAGAPA